MPLSTPFPGDIRTEPHGALIGSQRLPLSPTESKLLQLIIAAGATPLSRSRIEKQLYGSDGRRSNSIEVAICRLRGKLAPHHYSIHATRGQGYTISRSATS
ncbi:helix-turn-helix domain-containing protein [uncultured Stenotrophomonas sp.]|uniref:helix-turn-helix domain-containing protein n=1 Tax=uncultured Stenotrophomonas sp. TaxID=165438 RepID=UPI0025F46E5C|nr:helix-turn-helix domain-containing protein [uncultured Stenotrophomonas sp.]